jgi:hypothetical protein
MQLRMELTRQGLLFVSLRILTLIQKKYNRKMYLAEQEER